jgi:predicted regulator of Ras-like GTPase activity (Roadblock/LC7/MglB family)
MGVGRGEHMSELSSGSRSDRLDRAIHGLLAQTPEIEAAAVVSFDGLPMASALPPSMDEDRVAAMSAALLSLGERAAQGLGRGELSQVYIEGDAGTVFLVSADDEAVLVAVAAKGAKVGMMLFEVRRAAALVADVLRAEEPAPAPEAPVYAEAPVAVAAPEPLLSAVPSLPSAPVYAQPEPVQYAQAEAAPAWSSYAPSGSVLPGDNPTWS